ncbi:hypothetical protein E5676_scaffold451G001460 [Cucumis melo var. makuwa]|uniref:Uncharacterized protein n=1 Tax=Cucumis melo var. makuwa TaxID=1194695 RepID=A0A5D3BRD1_CUCMM|nr:hypothetical protein E5676_scaffold451G001460 [Cucumis melo var. makuwa]
MDTFLQTGNACERLLEVDKAIMNIENLLEAKINVRYNYCSFIPATIKIKDKNGHSFIVHIVTICSGKWLAERDVKINSSFKRQVAIEFDNFNSEAKQFTFSVNLAILADEFEIPKNKSLMAELTLEGNPTHAKEINDKDLRKSDINEMDNVSARFGGKRKVFFLSPKNKTIFFNTNHASAIQTENAESSRKFNSNDEPKQRKKPGKKRNTGLKPTIPSLIVKPTQSNPLDDQHKEGDLTIDLGHLSIINPQLHIQFEDHSDSRPDIVKATQDTDHQKHKAQIANIKDPQENVLPKTSPEDDIMIKEEEDDFKVKLIQWLKENNLKLATTINDPAQQKVAKTASDQVGIEDERVKENEGNKSFK